jgi:hypothetical protein
MNTIVNTIKNIIINSIMNTVIDAIMKHPEPWRIINIQPVLSVFYSVFSYTGFFTGHS